MVYGDQAETKKAQAFLEVLREDAILAQLDPDGLDGYEMPSSYPESARGEWEEFVALCDRLDAEESSSGPRHEESDRSAGSM